VDTWTGEWLKAAPAGDLTWSGTTPALLAGVHILYAFAADGQEATSINTGTGSSPIAGGIAAYLFVVSSGPHLALTHSIMPTAAVPGETITYSLGFTNDGSLPVTDLVLTDIIPVSVTLPSIISSGALVTNTGASPAFVWQVQDLAPGQSGMITIIGQLSTTLASGPLTTLAEISAAGPQYTRIDASATLAVLPANTALNLTVSPTATVYGQVVTLTATVGVVAPSAGEPTGKVTFYADGTLLGFKAISDGMVVYTTSRLATTTQVISTTYTGNSNFATKMVSLSGEVMVSKAPLTATADSVSRLFGVLNPALTYSWAGFANAETQSVLSGRPTITTPATQWSPPGVYPITLSLGTLQATNYTFAFAGGALTVSGSTICLPLVQR
jgi:uncharacterized repeat protein (TIGR01451 family)